MTERRTVTLDQELIKRVEKHAKIENRSFSNMCQVLITEALKIPNDYENKR